MGSYFENKQTKADIKTNRQAGRMVNTFKHDWEMFSAVEMRWNLNFYLGNMNERWPAPQIIELSSDDELEDYEDDDT